MVAKTATIKQRIGRRVVSEYIGNGEVADLIYQMNCLDREPKATIKIKRIH